MEDGKKLIVHFLEYDEYIESSVESKKRRIGDILEGEIAIGLVEILSHETIPKQTACRVDHHRGNP